MREYNKNLWEIDFKYTKEKINRFYEFKNQIIKTAGNLYSYLEEKSEFKKDIENLYNYAKNEKNSEMINILSELNNLFLEITKSLDEEILNLDEDKLLEFIKLEPNLGKYNIKK